MKKIIIATALATPFTGCQSDSGAPAVSALKSRLADPSSLQIEHLREFEMCGGQYVEIKYTADGDAKSDRVWWNGSTIYDSSHHQLGAMNARHRGGADDQKICEQIKEIESAG